MKQLNTIQKNALKACVALCISVFGLSAAQAQTAQAVPAQATQNANAPDVLVERVVKDVFSTIRQEKIKSTDVKRLSSLVDQKIMPHADIEATTKNIVGPAWNQASAAQRTQIMQEFKMLLIKTYAGALTKVGQQDVKFKPVRMLPTDTKVIVKTEVLDGGSANNIDYKLYKKGSEWKVYDLNILGVGLIATFKPDFASQINKSGVDGLITFLKEKNKN
jgi:phospholipid transport system substrate-binding protein